MCWKDRERLELSPGTECAGGCHLFLAFSLGGLAVVGAVSDFPYLPY